MEVRGGVGIASDRQTEGKYAFRKSEFVKDGHWDKHLNQEP